MVDLTTCFKTTKHLLDSGTIPQKPRSYLGMSGLGDPCARKLWYDFRWYSPDAITPRLKRLFARGHREEPEIEKILREIGYIVNDAKTIEDILADTGCTLDEDNQIEMVAGFGHMKGHSDGVVENVVEAPLTVHLAEYKTASDSKFKGYKKVNNLKKSHPVYYAQTQLYMHFLKLTRCLWIVVNKNDDDLHIERIRYDKGFAEDLIRKGESIIIAEFPHKAAYPSKTFFECRWCNHKEICWSNAAPQMNCRTCDYISIEHGGKWECIYHKAELSTAKQRKGCENYTRVT